MIPPRARPLERGDVAGAAALLHTSAPATSIVTTMNELSCAASGGGSLVALRGGRLTGVAVVEPSGVVGAIQALASTDAASLGAMVDALAATHSELDFSCARHHRWRSELRRAHRFEVLAEEVEVVGRPAIRPGRVGLVPADPVTIRALADEVSRGTSHRRLARQGVPPGDVELEFVAWSAGEPVGVALLDVADGVGAARLLGIRPDRRGRGLGTALVAAVLTKLEELGCDRYEDATDVDNAPMRRAFAACGCVERTICEWLVRIR